MPAPEKVVATLSPQCRITYDANQWMVQTRKAVTAKWHSNHFVGSTGATLERILDEIGVRVPPKLKKALRARSEAFLDWYNKQGDER